MWTFAWPDAADVLHCICYVLKGEVRWGEQHAEGVVEHEESGWLLGRWKSGPVEVGLDGAIDEYSRIGMR